MTSLWYIAGAFYATTVQDGDPDYNISSYSRTYRSANGITWAAAPVSLPSQTGNSGKYLTTDGSTASWATITTDPKADIFLLMGA
jgi:hypothetical protein